MLKEEVLLGLLQARGPSLPSELKRDVGVDLILTSAMLSNLASTKKVKISAMKIGSSPLYYVPGHEAQLLNFTHKLPEKEQRALALLKEKIVLRDADLDPLTRVCLQSIKDFAEALTVTIGDKKEQFWRFFLSSDQETEAKIRELLTPKVAPKPVEVVIPKPTPTTSQPIEPLKVPKSRARKKKATPEVGTESEAKETPKTEQAQKESTVGRAVKAIKELIAPASDVTEATKEAALSSDTPVSSDTSESTASTTQVSYDDDPFYVQLAQFFKTNNISIKSTECIRKKLEYDFMIALESPVGSLNYYCKAKNKKKLSEGDISSFFLKSQSKKLPILLLTTGELSKQAEDLMKTELQGLTIKKL